MEIVYARCAGLDVHKQTVVACRLSPDPAGKLRREIRSFGTMTDDLLALVDWLHQTETTTVAMESTGEYWKPIYNLLEGEFELLVVNAHHLKAVPGRKTDVKDAEWIADLLRHGLLKASFIPDPAQREVRELTRLRTTLVQDRARVLNRIQKVLEQANLKLASVVSDIDGVSARAMLEALAQGERDPKQLAALARGQLRDKQAELERALNGRMQPAQQLMLQLQLAQLRLYEQQIAALSAEIGQRLAPFEATLVHLDTIPGVGRQTAEVIVAEIGTDMSRFPSAAHLCAWAGVAPGNNVSGGKRRSSQARHGNASLKAALTQAAQGAVRHKDCYLAARYRRLKLRCGGKRASLAVAHTILEIAYHLIRRQEDYRELGADFYDQRNRTRTVCQLTKRLERLGYTVSLTTAAA